MAGAALAIAAVPAFFQKQIIASGGVNTWYGVVDAARFKNIPRVAYRSSMGRYKMEVVSDATPGTVTAAQLVDAARNAIATASSIFLKTISIIHWDFKTVAAFMEHVFDENLNDFIYD